MAEKDVCPECAQGKHVNCTVMMLDAEDREVHCGCGMEGHPR